MFKIIIAIVAGAALALSGERLADKSDPGVARATETVATQESIEIDAPAPQFHYLPPDEAE